MTVHREMRDDNPRNKANWALDCAVLRCGARFHPDTTVGVLAAHWSLHEPEATTLRIITGQAYDPEKPVLNLVWIGVGPNPEARPA